MKKISKTIIISLIISLNSTMIAFADTNHNEYLKNEIYNHMENWDTEFSFIYNNRSALDILQEAAQCDDYLERSISLYKTSRINNKFNVKIEYRTTKEEENIIDQELKKVVSNLITPSMTEIEKVKAVNEYIVKIYKYDYNLKSDNVYSAMKSGTTICQGYAMTAYKMFKMIGIDCRIVNGSRENISHSWNLVKINNRWYHLDITNNDRIIRDKYLLKSDKYMSDNGFVWDKNKYESAYENYYNRRTEYVDYNNDKEDSVSKYYNLNDFIY